MELANGFGIIGLTSIDVGRLVHTHTHVMFWIAINKTGSHGCECKFEFTYVH